MRMSETAIHYRDSVNYSFLDEFGKRALEKFSSTWANPNKSGIRLLEESVGETAQVFEIKDMPFLLAKNSEILGTKIAVAVEMAKRDWGNRAKYFHGIPKDTANMSLNDVSAVGSQPFSYTPVIGMGENEFLEDEEIMEAFLEGYLEVANENSVSIDGGETGTLRGIVFPGQADLSGSSLGIIEPKERFCHGGKVMPGDILYGLVTESPHANGLSTIRKVEERLPHGYFTEMPSGELFGEAVLRPTPSYSPVINALFDAGVDIHYLQPITGHGLRKIARSKRDLTYVVSRIPEPSEIFQFIQREQGIGDQEMAETYNCGIGFVIYAPKDNKILNIVEQKGMKALVIGNVREGPRKVLVNRWS